MFIIEILKETIGLFIDMAPYLVLGLVFAGLLNLLFSKETVARHLGTNNFWSVLKAAMLGVPLPLCSCGVIPSSVFMKKSGASNGATVSFLISTPQTGIDSIIATYGMMGPVFAIFRPFAALFMGVVGGTTVMAADKFLPEKAAHTDAGSSGAGDACEDGHCPSGECSAGSGQAEGKSEKKSVIRRFFKYSFMDFVDDISVQFIFGLLIAGVISYSIPDGFFENASFNSGIIGMLVMMAIGIPLYVCATASIPIALTLMMKGFSPGVAFVFLATGPATNAASISILLKVLGKRTTGLFLLSISLSSIAMGYLLDFIFSLVGISPLHYMNHEHGAGMIGKNLSVIISIAFAAIIAASIWRKFIQPRISKRNQMEGSKETRIVIDGMSCNHCVMNVEKAIRAVPGVERVEVRLNEGAAYIEGRFNLDALVKSIEAVGYKVVI